MLALKVIINMLYLHIHGEIYESQSHSQQMSHMYDPRVNKESRGRENEKFREIMMECVHTLKSSIVTARESSTSASIESSSKSIRSIFSRICWRAASEQRDAKSAPTWPWVSWAIYSKKKNHIVYPSFYNKPTVSLHVLSSNKELKEEYLIIKHRIKSLVQSLPI